MTWSYSGDPSSSPKDEMRFLLGDTINMAIFPAAENGDQAFGLLQDEEINYALNKYAKNYVVGTGGGAFFTAAKILADSLVAKWSVYVTESTGDESVSASDRIENYRRLSLELANKIAFDSLSIYTGGTSITEDTLLDVNTDLKRPNFRIGIDDNPWAIENPSPGQLDYPWTNE